MLEEYTYTMQITQSINLALVDNLKEHNIQIWQK